MVAEAIKEIVIIGPNSIFQRDKEIVMESVVVVVVVVEREVIIMFDLAINWG